MDSSSFELLVSVIQQIPELLVVVSYRKEEANNLFAALASEKFSQQNTLQPFTGKYQQTACTWSSSLGKKRTDINSLCFDCASSANLDSFWIILDIYDYRGANHTVCLPKTQC